MRRTRSKNGSATILMMLIAAVIVTVGLGFNWLVREHIRASEGLKNKADAILKARSAYDTVIYLILNGQLSPKEIIVAGGADITELKTLPLDGQRVSFSEDLFLQIQDSNGMLSLSNLNTVALDRLIRNETGLDIASGAINSLLDWIDIDDLTRINGAGKFYYRGQGLPYGPRNYALQYKEEVGFIKGFENGIYEKLQPYLTMLPSMGFNPNTASDAVLMAYLNIGKESLKSLRDFMSQKAITSDLELFALTGWRRAATDEGGNYFPSLFMDIAVSAGAPKTIYTIRAGLNLSQNLYFPYGVIYWREE